MAYHFASFFPNPLFTIPCDHAAAKDAQAPLPQPAQAAPNSALALELAFNQASPSPSRASPLSSGNHLNECGNSACKLICLCENTPSTASTKPTWSPLSSESAPCIPSTYWNIASGSSVSSIIFSSTKDDDDEDQHSIVSSIIFSSTEHDEDDEDEDQHSSVSTIFFSSSEDNNNEDDDDEDDGDEDDNDEDGDDKDEHDSQSEGESAPVSRPNTPGSVIPSSTNFSNLSNHSNRKGLRSPLPSHSPPPASTRVKTLMQDMGLRVQTQSLEELEALHAQEEEEELSTREVGTTVVKMYPPLAWRNGWYASGPRPERARVVGYCVVYEE
jgi:hypothetical protein